MITDTVDQLTTVERQQGRDEGKLEGKLEGKFEGLRQTLELVLARSLTEAESLRLARYLAAHGVDLELIRAMRSEPAELEAWLRAPGANGMATGTNGHGAG